MKIFRKFWIVALSSLACSHAYADPSTFTDDELQAEPALVFPSFEPGAGPQGMEVRIVNGLLTASHAEVAAVVEADHTNTLIEGSNCTAVLIGCRWLVTAAHCTRNMIGKSGFRVFFPNRGFFKIESVEVNPDFTGCQSTWEPVCARNDIGLIKLVSDVKGIAPAKPKISAALPPGDFGEIVGFGYSEENSTRRDFGLKRVGRQKLALCQSDPTGWVCWSFSSGQQTTCFGDSGGPLYPSNGSLAGVTSFGAAGCSVGSQYRSARVSDYISWIKSKVGNDFANETCTGNQPAGSLNAPTKVASVPEGIRADGQMRAHALRVPINTAGLRISASGVGNTYRSVSDVKLKARLNGETSNRCVTERVGNLAYCEIESPPSGDWTVGVGFSDNISSSAKYDYQIIITALKKLNN